ncbi:S49 family peptidase [Rhodoplanes sp. SY1]|uniref:S49 family peptidase n=1 Tax=Rhodoplanes sp. SY1 TaxID=3166646 RepID=UPI0038B69A65
MPSPSITAWPAALAARPLLVYEPHALEIREAYLEAESTAAAPQAAAGAGNGTSGPRYAVQNGVAVIPIRGALLSGGDYMGSARFTSYDAIAKEVRRATLDPQVRSIVTAINSPGGTVDGILGAAGAIREARAAGKPVVAHVTSMAASAGYWLAAQSDEIVLGDELALVGSIGVYTMHLDLSKLLQDFGLNVSLIHAGRHKVDGHPFGPLPHDVRGRIQASVDDLRSVFAHEVAAGRPKLSVEQALATEASVFHAYANPRTGDREAITKLLADRVASLDTVISSMQSSAAKTHKVSLMHNDTTIAGHRDRIAAGWRRAVAEANAGLGLETAAADEKIMPPSGRAGWARAVAEANRELVARHGFSDAVSTVPAGPVSGNSSGWAKAIAAANSGQHPGAIRNGGAVSPGSGA